MEQSKAKADSRRWVLFFYIISFCLLVLLYGQTLFFDYVWDDRQLFIYSPALVNEPLSWHLLAKPVLEDTSYFRPFVFLSWFAEFHLFGLRPAISHGINVAVFYGCVVLTFFIVRYIFRTQKYANLLGLLSSLIYLCHPMNVEAVAWVAGRFDVFATFFLLLATYIFLRTPDGILRILLVTLAYLAALGSKEIGILFLPAVFCFWVLSNHQNKEKWLPVFKSFFAKNIFLIGFILALTAIYLFVRAYYASGLVHRAFNLNYIQEFYIKNNVPIVSLKEYILRTIFPFYDLGAFLPDFAFLQLPNRIISWTVIALLVIVSFWGIKKRNNFVFAIFGYIVMLSLVIHLIPITIANNIVQDRFLLSALPFYVIIYSYGMLLLISYTQKVYASIAMSGLYMVSLIIINLQLVPIWQNEVKFWYHMSAFQEKYTHEFHPMYLRALMEVGAPLGEIEKLIAKERAKVKITKKFRPVVFILYGQYLVDRGDPRGVQILAEFFDVLVNEIGDNYKVEGLSRHDVFAIYYSYSYGLLNIRHDIAEAARVFALGQKYGGEDKTIAELRLNITLNLLQNKMDAARKNFSELREIKNLNLNSVMSGLNKNVADICSKMDLNIPACKPEFNVWQLRD